MVLVVLAVTGVSSVPQPRETSSLLVTDVFVVHQKPNKGEGLLSVGEKARLVVCCSDLPPAEND